MKRGSRLTAPLIIATLLLSACAGAASPPATAPPAPPPTAPRSVASSSTATLLPEEPPPRDAALEFTTDFSRHSIPYGDIVSGGPPKDGIRALDHPAFVAVPGAGSWLRDVEPVIFLRVGDDVRAYPLQILVWHEVVNDTVGGVPVAITFCPLCNTAIAFERKVAGQVLEFGSSGRLRYSNLIMFDRQSETWWQQASGEAIAGKLTGTRLVLLPASIVAWADFKAAFPGGKVLSRDTGFKRNYGRNPYAGYDDVNTPPFLYAGPPTPEAMPPVARVLTIDVSGEAVAYPYDVLKKVGVVNDRVGGVDVVVLWATGTASALDAETVSGGRDVGAANAFARSLDGRTLSFALKGSRVVDDETGSEWSVLGRAVRGELAGKELTPVVAVNHLWFSWAAFRPETRIYRP